MCQPADCCLLLWLERRRQWHPTPVLLPGKSHGRRSLVGCSPWAPSESDTTEHLHCHFSVSFPGEGNSNALQCSRLENPREGGVWWAAVYGVAQSQTRLKWLSSSSSSSMWLERTTHVVPGYLRITLEEGRGADRACHRCIRHLSCAEIFSCFYIVPSGQRQILA